MNLPRIYFKLTEPDGREWAASSPLVFESATVQLKHVREAAKLRHIKTKYELITKEQHDSMIEEHYA
jgi:hypothetical protein